MVLRSPDCICNPYHVFAFMIYASLEGIENKLFLEEKFDPDKQEYKRLPLDICEAADTAEKSEFLKKHIDTKILHYVIDTAREEWKEYQAASDKEQFEEKRYFYDL